jgi:hypothetical protein
MRGVYGTFLKNLLMLALPAGVANARPKDDLYLFGPVLHANLRDGKIHFSLGVEGSYWNLDRKVGYSYGMEYDFRKQARLYGELQAGFLAGASVGPVLQVSGQGLDMGMQGSLWASWFLGIDCRYRLLTRSHGELAPGVFAKLPTGGNARLFPGPDSQEY